MLHRDESVGINRLEVVGPDGENIGGVEAVYVDGATNEPEFALIGFGFFRLRYSFVPMKGARTDGDELHVRYSKDMVKHAPYLRPRAQIDDLDASALYEHYGIQRAAPQTQPEPAAAAEREAAPSAPSESEPVATVDGQPATEPGPVAPGAGGPGGARRSRDLGGASTEQPTTAPDAAVTGDAGEPVLSDTVEEGAAAAAHASGPPGTAVVIARGKRAPDEEPSDDGSGTSLADRTVAELRQMAADQDITGRSSMNKGELIEALSLGHGGESRSGSARAYEDWTVDELRQLAAERDISGRSSMNKGDLIDALRGR